MPPPFAGRPRAAAGNSADAVRAALAALKRSPDSYSALVRAAGALERAGRKTESLRYYERAIRANGSAARAHYGYGCVLMDLERFEEAAGALARAVELRAEYPQALDSHGVALSRLGKTDAAIASFRKALAWDASYGPAIRNLSVALLEAGDLDEAKRWAERAIEVDPRDGRSYLLLLNSSREGVAEKHLDAMVRLADAGETLPVEQRIALHFALGQAFERAGRIDESFRHYREGNALKRAELSYDEAAALEFLRSTEVAFTNPIVKELRACGDPSERPVFIFGMPRSGSTLVEQLLAAHPEVAAGGELNLLGPIVKESWPKIKGETIENLRREVRRIGERYLRATDAVAGPAARLTDKRLDNFQLAPLIAVTLPNARMIHVYRDGLDTCFSCFATLFVGDELPFTYEPGELGRYYSAYRRMMDKWRAFVPADRLLEVSYEQLLDDFEGEARRIVEFCGLQWNAACLEFHRVRRAVRTASNFQVRQPLYRSSRGRAQRFLAYLDPAT